MAIKLLANPPNPYLSEHREWLEPPPEAKLEMGDRIEIQDETGRPLAVGLVSYRSDEIKRLQGRKRTEYKNVLGYEYVKEIVHRDDMVMVE